jgi:hypothetical protein
MNLRDNIHEWIDSYLSGEMSQGERTEFENRLKTDEEFARTFEAQKVSHQIVVGQELVQLKAQMAKDLSGNSAGSNTWKYITGAAVVAILVVLYFLSRNNETTPPIETKKEVYTKDSLIVPDTSTTDSLIIPEEIVPEKEATESKTPTGVKEPVKTCTDTLISFSCQARAACVNENNGAIEVDINTIKSGKAPYEFSIHPQGEFVQDGTIRDLKAGKYNLYVKDAGKCIRKLNVKVEVPTIQCDHKHK